MTGSNSATTFSPRRRRARLQDVTSQIVLSYESCGRINIKGFTRDSSRLPEVTRLVAMCQALSDSGSSAPSAAVLAPIRDDGASSAPIAAESDWPSGSLAIADPGAFLRVRVERLYNGWVSVREMWSAYQAWSASLELSIVSRSVFNERLRANGLRYARRQPSKEVKQERGWAGGRLWDGNA